MSDNLDADHELVGLVPLPPSTMRMVDQVHLALQEALAAGRVRPGARLLEVQVAAQLGVSRTPVREAFQRLEAEGLAHRTESRGLVFTDINSADVEDLGRVRTVLDTLAAQLAVERATPGAWTAVETAMEGLAQALRLRAGRAPAVREAHRALHLEIYRLAFTPLVSTFLATQVLQFLDISTRLHTAPDVSVSTLKDHQTLVAALRSGDSQVAAAAAFTHASTGARQAGAQMRAAAGARRNRQA